MRTCSAHTIQLAAPRPSFILDRRAPYVCAEPGAVVRTLRRRSDLMWSLALSRPLALGLAWLPAPCTFTRVVRGRLRHARSLEWCAVACAIHGHSSGAWLYAPSTVTRAVRAYLQLARSRRRTRHSYRTLCAARRGLVARSCVFLQVRPYVRPCFAVSGGWQVNKSPQGWGLGGRCGSLLEAQLVWNWHVWIQIARLVRAAAFVVGLGA